MKKVLFAILVISMAVSCSSSRKAVSKGGNYETTMDGDTKILKGTISRSVIENDTAFKWFKANMSGGQADANAVDAFKKNGAKFSMIVFGGTWCGDTQNLLPIFYRLIEKSGYPENKITLIGVDRAKTAPNDLHKTYNISRVPTFIVIKDGKEVGRVIEYGTMGEIDKELGTIVAGL